VPLTPGTHLGVYEVLAPLGKGGKGEAQDSEATAGILGEKDRWQTCATSSETADF
jgi:hypothetical protein